MEIVGEESVLVALRNLCTELHEVIGSCFIPTVIWVLERYEITEVIQDVLSDVPFLLNFD